MSRSAELHRHSNMNIAITGATGVIGRHAVKQLINAGHRVTGVTRSARGARELRIWAPAPRERTSSTSASSAQCLRTPRQS